jgi:hypothetical protein
MTKTWRDGREKYRSVAARRVQVLGERGVFWCFVGHSPQHIAVRVFVQDQAIARRINGTNLRPKRCGPQSSQISVDNFVDMLSVPVPNPHGIRLVTNCL